jgi:2'-5' RNA ligase
MAQGIIRAFVAIPLPEDLLDQLGRLQRRLEVDAPPNSIRWVRKEGIHLTLKFLGDTNRKKLPEITAALGAVARHAPPCTISVKNLGCFPNPRRPRVLWVGVEEPTERLAVLQDAIEEVLVPFGHEREERGFHPHLTLGRVRRRVSHDDKEAIGELVKASHIGTLSEFEADQFTLIRSVLKRTGAEYTDLETFQLS